MSITLTDRDKAALDAALSELNRQAQECETPALSRVLSVAAQEIDALVHGEAPSEI